MPNKKKIVKRSIWSIAVVLLLSIGAYFFFYPKRVLQLAIPDFNGVNFVKATIKNDTAYVNLQSILKNRAPYIINIDSIFYKIKLDTTLIVSERQAVKLVQESGDVDTAVLGVRLPIKKIRNTIKSLQSKDSTYLVGDFAVEYSTFLGHMTLNYSKKEKIQVPVPPEIKITNVSRRKVKLLKGEAYVDVEISVTNHSPTISVHLDDLQYTVQLGERIAGQGHTEQKIKVEPKSSVVVTLPLYIDVDKPLKTLWDVYVKQDAVSYRVVLNAMLSNNNIEEVPVELVAIGNTKLVE